MPKDFRKTSAPRRKNKQSHGIVHAPSFVMGVVAGAVLVIFGAYAPEFIGTPAAAPQAASADDAAPELEFEFPKLLAQSQVATNPEPYAADLPGAEASVASEFLIQAASFRDADDAETLRAQLLLQDMPVSMSRVALNDGSWYRVTVGPYESQTETARALTRLRQQDLRAIVITREKG